MPGRSPVSPVTLQLLVQFEALIQERHVTRAAERMGISQSTMSAALARLRRQFGDPLLIRTAKGMVPTAKALELARRARVALELLEPDRLHERTFRAQESERHFRILTTEGLALLLAPPIANHLRQHAPGIRLTIQPSDMRGTVEALRDQACDLTIGHILHPPSDLRKKLIYPQSACCIVSGRHPEIDGRITLRQFLKYPHVVWGADETSYRSIETSVARALGNARHPLKHAIRVPNILIVPAVVAATDMIATVPLRIAREAAERLDIKAVQPPFKLANPDISMYWHELNHRDQAHIWFRQSIQTIAQAVRAPLSERAGANAPSRPSGRPA